MDRPQFPQKWRSGSIRLSAAAPTRGSASRQLTTWPRQRSTPARSRCGASRFDMRMKKPPHPGRIVRQECIEPLGLTVKEAAKRLGVTRQTLNNVVNDRAAISPEMTIRLSKQINVKSWLNAHLFQRPDLYPIFEGLYKSGADLDYVVFLCFVFGFWEETRRSLGFDRRRGLIPLSLPNTKLNGQQRLSEVGRPCDALRDPVKFQELLDRKGQADMWFGKMNQFLDVLSDACAKAPIF